MSQGGLILESRKPSCRTLPKTKTRKNGDEILRRLLKTPPDPKSGRRQESDKHVDNSDNRRTDRNH